MMVAPSTSVALVTLPLKLLVHGWRVSVESVLTPWNSARLAGSRLPHSTRPSAVAARRADRIFTSTQREAASA